ncbi:MAG: AAA family ATPase, partial [Pseudomonadota bacterium]
MLADNIGRGRVDEDRRGPSPIVGASATENRGWHLRLPLVGRSEEHSQLVAAFLRASQDTQLVTLIGAAGSGKTRLVSAFQEWAKLDLPEVEIWQGRAF